MKTLSELKYAPSMLKVSELEISKYNTRYNRIDANLVEQIKQSVISRGYDENFPLSVGILTGVSINADDNNGSMEVLGGAHRLMACKELGLKEVPANIYRDITPDEAIAISYNNNQNQQTFKPETFLDLAYRIYDWNENEGKSHEAIGGILGMSKQNVSYHYTIIKHLASDVLGIVENTLSTQIFGFVDNEDIVLVDGKSTRVDKIDWKLGWFRHITPLPHRYQRHIVDRVLVNENKTTTKMVEGWSKLFKRRSVLEQYIKDNVPAEHLDSYIASLDSGTYDMQMDDNGNPNNSLIAIIEQLKQESQNRLENIDCLELIPVSDYAAGGRIWDANLCRGSKSMLACKEGSGGFKNLRTCGVHRRKINDVWHGR